MVVVFTDIGHIGIDKPLTKPHIFLVFVGILIGYPDKNCR
jgi:hypothetical protein